MTPSESRDSKQTRQADQIANMREQQAQGNLPMVAANRTVTVTPPTRLNISEVRADEADRFVHVFTRVKHDDPVSKQYNNEDKIIQIHMGEFDRKIEQKYFQLFDEIQVIHDPRKGAPSTYKFKEEKATPAAASNSADLNERVRNLRLKETELDGKEAALVAKQAELEAMEAKMLAYEAGAALGNTIVESTSKK